MTARGLWALACDAGLIAPVAVMTRGSIAERFALRLEGLVRPQDVDLVFRADLNLGTPKKFLEQGKPFHPVTVGAQPWN